jgi:predicted ATPase
MLLQSIALRNLLSFREVVLPLRGLNVLIGPNGSGKSNLIETIRLLKALPTDFGGALRSGGGVEEWIWKWGGEHRCVADIECQAGLGGESPTRYLIRFAAAGSALEIVEEAVEQRGSRLYSHHSDGDSTIVSSLHGSVKIDMPGWELSRKSVFSAFRDPTQYPAITRLGAVFDKIRIYRDWNVSQLRFLQRADATTDFLNENGDNFALVLNRMERERGLAQAEAYLGRFCSRFGRIYTGPEGGAYRLWIKEQGISNVPMTRLSDGTLRFLCLLSILCHPNPPPLVCIEEPELGMHPDSLRLIAELLIEASERTQLIVTTHSPALVDAFSERPESVVVCEHHGANGTVFQRLSAEQLREWLEHYSLGELWQKGELGGVLA